MLKSALLLLLVAFIFVGTGGVRIFTHSCEISGASTAYFIEPTDPCSVIEVKKSCCSADVVSCSQPEDEDGCCDSETDVVQLKFQFFEHSTFAVPQLIGVVPSLVFEDFSPKIKSNGVLTAFNLPPPKLQGRELSIINCVYRI